MGIALAEASAGDALGGASLTPAISVASGMLILRKGDEVVGVIEQATGRAVSLSDDVLANLGARATKKRIFDFDRGRTAGSYDALSPGPLDDSLAGTFSGGRYNEVVLTEDVVLHRAGTGDRPLGQFFTQQPADGILQSRINNAVLPNWPGGGASPIDSTFEVRIPAGTRVYVGEVSSQGGVFVGGMQQVVVPRPWEIDGVEVLSRSPLP